MRRAWLSALSSFCYSEQKGPNKLCWMDETHYSLAWSARLASLKLSTRCGACKEPEAKK